MAELTRFELATFRVTGGRSNQLSYSSKRADGVYEKNRYTQIFLCPSEAIGGNISAHTPEREYPEGKKGKSFQRSREEIIQERSGIDPENEGKVERFQSEDEKRGAQNERGEGVDHPLEKERSVDITPLTPHELRHRDFLPEIVHGVSDAMEDHDKHREEEESDHRVESVAKKYQNVDDRLDPVVLRLIADKRFLSLVVVELDHTRMRSDDDIECAVAFDRDVFDRNGARKRIFCVSLNDLCQFRIAFLEDLVGLLRRDELCLDPVRDLADPLEKIDHLPVSFLQSGPDVEGKRQALVDALGQRVRHMLHEKEHVDQKGHERNDDHRRKRKEEASGNVSQGVPEEAHGGIVWKVRRKAR